MFRTEKESSQIACANRALLLGLALSAVPGHAADGTITITGEIIDQTCKINGKDSPADILVQLPKIANSALKNKGDTAGATLFTINLSDCPSTLAGRVKAHFEPGATLDYTSGNLYAYTLTQNVTSAASSIPDSMSSMAKVNNVQIQLANPDGSAITIGDDSKTQGAELTGSGEKSATLRYLARYIKSGNGTINAGKLVTYVQYSIAYP